MPELLGEFGARIAELNDGSFVVDDQETLHRGVVAGKQANVTKASAPFGALAFSRPHIKLPCSILFSSPRRPFSLAPMNSECAAK